MPIRGRIWSTLISVYWSRSVGSADLVQVIRNQAVSGPLGEEANGDQNNKAMLIPRAADQFEPRAALQLLLHCESLFDLIKFTFDKLALLVALGMHMGKDLHRLVISSL